MFSGRNLKTDGISTIEDIVAYCDLWPDLVNVAESTNIIRFRVSGSYLYEAPFMISHMAYPSGSQSVILKRKCNNPGMPSTYMRGGIEYEDTGMFYLIIYRNGEYDVKNEKDILIDEDDDESGVVMIKCKSHTVQIVKKGTQDYINKKAKLYGYNLPIETNEEDEAVKRMKIIDAKTGLAGSKKVVNKPLEKLKQQESRIMPLERDSDDEDDSNIMSKLSISNPANNSNKSTSSKSTSSKSTSSKSTSPKSISSKSISSKSTSPKYISPTPPILVNADIDEEMDDEEVTPQTTNVFQELQAFRDELREMREERRPKAFLVTGHAGKEKDLVQDFHGRSFVKWALKVADFIWLEEELVANTLEPSDRTDRGVLCCKKKDQLKAAYEHKYVFEREKQDNGWARIVTGVNGKGRGYKHRKSLGRVLAFFRRNRSSMPRSQPLPRSASTSSF